CAARCASPRRPRRRPRSCRPAPSSGPRPGRRPPSPAPAREPGCDREPACPSCIDSSSGDTGPMTAKDAWPQAYDASPRRDAEFATMSGIPVEAVYGPDDGEFPGRFPYTRGPYASMYRSKLWTMRMFAGFGTPEDTNRRFHEILRAGGDGLSTAFDLPTLLGRDSDDPASEGEVGKCGVAVDTLADMEDLFAGIDLGSVTTSMTINSPAAVILAMYIAVAERNGVERSRLG